MVSRIECRQGIRTFVNEGLHTSRSQCVFPCRDGTGETYVLCAASFKAHRGRGQVLLGRFARWTEADDRSLCGMIIGRSPAERFNPAGFEKVLGKIQPRCEFRRRAERREENS